jgi:hypothetical protein
MSARTPPASGLAPFFGIPGAGSTPSPSPSPPAAPAAAPAGRGDGAGSPLAASPGLSLDIDARRKVEVDVNLRPGATGRRLTVPDLRGAAAGEPRLSGVRIESRANEERVVLHLAVPDDCPAGTYSGLILDEDSAVPQGMLSVTLGPAAAPPATALSVPAAAPAARKRASRPAGGAQRRSRARNR